MEQYFHWKRYKSFFPQRSLQLSPEAAHGPNALLCYAFGNKFTTCKKKNTFAISLLRYRHFRLPPQWNNEIFLAEALGTFIWGWGGVAGVGICKPPRSRRSPLRYLAEVHLPISSSLRQLELPSLVLRKVEVLRAGHGLGFSQAASNVCKSDDILMKYPCDYFLRRKKFFNINDIFLQFVLQLT